MNCPQVLPDLKRVIGGEGRALLQRLDLLCPLVEQMVTQAVLADVEISHEELDQARLELLEQRGYGRLHQWPELLDEIGRSHQTVEETHGRLMQTRANWLRQLALLDQQMAQLNPEVLDISSRLSEARVTLRYQQLKSPLDGVLFDLQPTSAGYTAQSIQTVMKVVPFGSLEASVEVPSNKIGFVKVPLECPKQPARCINADIRIDSYPATDFGILRGKVTRIGSDALAPDPQEQRQELSCPVTVQLTQQQLQMKSGAKLLLQVGMSVKANVKLRKVSYLQLLLGEFQDKADSLQRL